jgi:hypothetical protein
MRFHSPEKAFDTDSLSLPQNTPKIKDFFRLFQKPRQGD